MAAGKTYEPIATTTLSGPAANITFSSISSSYTDLVLVLNTAIASGGTGESVIRFNSDSGSNYSNTYLYGNGSAAGSARNTSSTVGRVSYTAGSVTTVGNMNYIVYIHNYSNTSTYKTYLARANNASNGTDVISGSWRSSSAINSIQFFYSDSSNIIAGSIATLYGIAAA
jgi:hypothetical protein